MLLVQLIYLKIKEYQIKELITFECVLGEIITKNVEIKNPHDDLIQYRVIKEGSDDFVFKES